jgi:hypothetical protein
MATIRAGLELGPDSLLGWRPKFRAITGSGFPGHHGFEVIQKPAALILELLNQRIYALLGPTLTPSFLPELQ